MRRSELDASSGLFPAGTNSLSFRCHERDMFCWVFTDDPARDRLIALPDNQAAAWRELSATLERDHAFDGANAVLATRLLFERAFQKAAAPAPAAAVVDLHAPESAEPRRAGFAS